MDQESGPGADGALETRLAHERVVLLPGRALGWPAGGLLLVADPHFGKAALFRRGGVPVPRGTTGETLDRLDALLGRGGVERLVFLGDFLHGALGEAAATLDRLAAWRARWPAVRMTVVRGNHDRHAGDPPARLGMEVAEPGLRAGPFALCHEPVAVAGAHALCGHVHPARVLRGRRGERLRLPCFVLGTAHSILPAFGAFTGCADVEPSPGARIYVVAGDRVMRAP